MHTTVIEPGRLHSRAPDLVIIAKDDVPHAKTPMNKYERFRGVKRETKEAMAHHILRGPKPSVEPTC